MSDTTPTPRDLTKEIAIVAKDLTYPAFGGIMRPGDDVLALKGGSKGLAIYDDLERDPWVYACMHKRKMAVIGRRWIVEPASESRLDKKAAEMVQRHLEQVGFDPACYHLLDAILKGRSAGEIMWARDGAELCPVEVRPRDGRRFTFADDYSLRLLTIAQPLTGEQVPDKKFIVHTVGAKDGNPHGLGLGQKLWWPVYFKRQGLSFWLQFLDKFGAPTAIGKYQAGVDINQLEDALRRIAHDAGVALPEGAAVELLEATRSGTGTHAELCRYMDEQIAAAILGEGGGKGSGGELASAAILRNELRLELVMADADLLSAALGKTLVAWDVELNMPRAKPPRVWREVKEEEDLQARATRDKLLFDMGFRPTLDYVQDTYGGEWELVEPPKPTRPTQPLPGDSAPAAEFAESDPEATSSVAGETAALARATHPGEQALLDRVRQLSDQAPTLAALQAALVVEFSALPEGDLIKVMSAAFALAELKGIADVTDGR